MFDKLLAVVIVALPVCGAIAMCMAWVDWEITQDEFRKEAERRKADRERRSNRPLSW